MIGFMAGFVFNRDSNDEKSASSLTSQSAEGDERADSEGASQSRTSRGSESSQSGGTSRDSRIVGEWRYTETMVSEGITIVIDQFMTIEADGTMTVRDGKAVGNYGGEPWEPEPTNQSVTCEWRTNGNVIEIRGEGRDWSPLAEYEVNATTLMTTSQGERQIWERI
jgi:hypothetical protein